MNGGFSRLMESAIPTRILSTLPPKEELKSNESPWFPRLKLSPQAYSSHVSLIHPQRKKTFPLCTGGFTTTWGFKNPKGSGHDPSRCHAYWRLIIFIHLRCFTCSTNEGTPGQLCLTANTTYSSI